MNKDFVRVPHYVEKDVTKTFSLPNCRSKSGFKIGLKGSEELFTDYWPALSRLTSMRLTRFRCPNSEQNFGIVTCKKTGLEGVRSDFIMTELARHG